MTTPAESDDSPLARIYEAADGDVLSPVSDSAATVEWWESRVRRILLVAHVLPALFGLVAVLADDSRRRVDVAIWSVTVGWTVVVLALGWRRGARTRLLVAWIMADALVMAGLMFIGTSARSVVSYVAVDGALFAAVFVSAPVALVQVMVVYSGLAAAALARARGSELPTPVTGWQTPILVTLAGILALRFLRSALDRLADALASRAQAAEAERSVLAEVAEEEAIAQSVAALDEELSPPLRELEMLAVAYSATADTLGAARREADWLVASSALARRELAGLQDVLGPVEKELLGDIVDTAILAACASHPWTPSVDRTMAANLALAELPQVCARAIAGFVREGVANALIHGAPPVSVSVEADGATLVVVVADGGSGYDPAAVAPGIGSDMIVEHAHAANGRIEREAPADDRPHRLLLVIDSAGTPA